MNGIVARIAAIGFVAPGMDGWAAARAVLAGGAAWAPTPLPRFKPALLPANERRRATWLTQLALRAVEDCLVPAPVEAGTSATSTPAPAPAPAPAVADADADADAPERTWPQLASVFASSGGDMGNLHALCTQLATAPKGISPTAFHNSVHNAVAGYFGIGAGARAPSTSLSAHDDSFVAGLAEAMAWLADRASPVLLVAYDAVAPEPLFTKRPVQPDVAVALLLAPDDDVAGPRIALARHHDDAAVATPLADAQLEALRLGNPAARALPLLRCLARGEPGALVLGDGEGARWQLEVRA